MSAKHTLGPLKLGRCGLSPAVVDEGGRLIAECPYHQSFRARYTLEEEAFANARLFAAAPELLEALAMIVDTWEHGGTFSDARNEIGRARAAIAKARGEAWGGA